MVNNNLQQDILKHMMADRIDIDMEEFVQNDAGKFFILQWIRLLHCMAVIDFVILSSKVGY